MLILTNIEHKMVLTTTFLLLVVFWPTTIGNFVFQNAYLCVAQMETSVWSKFFRIFQFLLFTIRKHLKNVFFWC